MSVAVIESQALKRWSLCLDEGANLKFSLNNADCSIQVNNISKLEQTL